VTNILLSTFTPFKLTTDIACQTLTAHQFEFNDSEIVETQNKQHKNVRSHASAANAHPFENARTEKFGNSNGHSATAQFMAHTSPIFNRWLTRARSSTPNLSNFPTFLSSSCLSNPWQPRHLAMPTGNDCMISKSHCEVPHDTSTELDGPQASARISEMACFEECGVI
jgi:hypothetical protein